MISELNKVGKNTTTEVFLDDSTVYKQTLVSLLFFCPLAQSRRREDIKKVTANGVYSTLNVPCYYCHSRYYYYDYYY